MKLALLLLCLAMPAAAQNIEIPGAGAAGGVAGAGIFTDRFVSAFNLSLAEEPHYASKLLQSFESHVAILCAIPTGKEAAAYLKSQALSPDAGKPKGLLESFAEFLTGPETPAGQARRLNSSLGTRPLAEKQASALLVANALLEPRQFHHILSRLDAAKPGFGKQIKNILKNAGGTSTSNPKTIAAFKALGDRIGPLSKGLTYDSKGEWDRFFDGQP